MSAVERASEANSAEQANERSGASERANGGANGPVLYASTSYQYYPMCIVRYGPNECYNISDFAEVDVQETCFCCLTSPAGQYLVPLDSHLFQLSTIFFSFKFKWSKWRKMNETFSMSFIPFAS